MHEALHAALFRQPEEVARASDHDPLELLRLALANRDQMDDHVDVVDGTAHGRRIGDVALDELAAPVAKLLRLADVADEAAHLAVLLAQRMDDMPADETGAAGDQDHCSKFFQ